VDRRGKISLVAFGLATVVAAAVLFGWRIAGLATLDPWGDQFFQIDWVRSLLAADHGLPRATAGQSWLAALKTDDGSAAHVVLAHVYAAHNLILTLASVAWFGLWGLLVGGKADAQAAIGIATHGLMVLALAWLPVLAGFGRSRGEGLAVGLLAFLFAAGSSTLQVFATIGFHNFALLLMVVSLVFGERWLAVLAEGGPAGRRGVQLLAVQTVALYAYFTNVFFLPSAVILAVLAIPGLSWACRLKAAGFHALGTALTLVPLPALMAVTLWDRGGAETNQDFVGWLLWAFVNGDSLGTGPLGRAIGWFANLSSLFSPAGLALGLAGLAGLAAVRGRRLPLALVAAHWLAGIVVPPFYGHGSRTAVYVLPLLCLGIAWALVAAARPLVFGAARRPAWRGAVLAVTAGLAMVHAAGEAGGWRVPRSVPPWTLDGRREGRWQGLVAALDARLPIGAVVVPSDYGTRYAVRALSRRIGGDLEVFRPLDVLYGAARAGRLPAYLAERGLTVAEHAPVYLLVSPLVPRDGLEVQMGAVLGGMRRDTLAAPSVTLRPVAWGGGVLFEVDVAPAGGAGRPAPHVER